MKVGFRFGKCILDIVNGDVLITDVLVLITNSRFNPNSDSQWAKTWQIYKVQSKEWDNGVHEEVYKYTVRRLYDLGKIHQPKMYGAKAHTYTEPWLEIVPLLRVDKALQKVTKSIWPDVLL